jgi:hypothetical protein
MSFKLLCLQREPNNNNTERVAFLNELPQGFESAATALALLPAIAAASAAPVAASAPAPSANERTRRITFTPTIDGAYPENLEPLPKHIIGQDFPDLESLNAHLKALEKAHKKLIAISKARAVFDSAISSHTTANISSKKTYSNSILGNRDIKPVVFRFTIQGSYIRTNRNAFVAKFHTAAEAYEYTVRLAKAHRTLLERAETRQKLAEQQARAPAPAAQLSQNEAVAFSSAAASLPAAPNNRRDDEFDEKGQDYRKEEVVGPSGSRTITESWTGNQKPPLIDGGIDPITYAEEERSYRLTIIPPPSSTTAPAPESPSSPLSPATPDTPPRSLSSAPNAAVTASKVVTKQPIKVDEGLLMIVQEWPEGEGDPDFPADLPKGYEVQSVTDDKVNGVCIRTLLLQKITVPAFAEKPD